MSTRAAKGRLMRLSLNAVLLLGILLHLNQTEAQTEECTSLNGDVDGNGSIELTDVILILNYAFVATVDELIPICDTSAAEGCTSINGDVDGNGAIDLTDAMLILNYAFVATVDELIPICEAKEGFTFLGKNEQGYHEYHHIQTGIIFVSLPGGTFNMGSTEEGDSRFQNERPVHEVTLSPFWISKYEVTQAQWEAVMGSNPSHNKGDDRRPVEMVSWDDVQEFEVKTGFTLPTEAQWEYSCRAGTTGPFAGTGNLDDMGWYSQNSEFAPAPVGMKKPNQFGIYDMHGNVWEWCEDVYDENFYEKPEASVRDPVCSAGSNYRPFRGGGWNCGSVVCRSAVRDWIIPSFHHEFIGFRPSIPSP